MQRDIIHDLLLNTSEAARLLGLKPATLLAWRYHGRPNLPFVRIGLRTIRYRLSDIEAFADAGRSANSGQDQTD